VNAGYAYRTRVGPTAHGKSIEHYLAAAYPHSSPAEWQARIDRGEIAIGGSRVERGAPLRRGDEIVWSRPPWLEPDVPRHFDVLLEDDDLVAVAKPSGLPTMPAGGFLTHTLLHLVRQRWPGADPVHRLGRATSGVVLFARSSVAAAALTRELRERQVEKVYRALVGGAPGWSARDVTTPIGPVPHPRLGTVHAADPRGRAAHSHLAVVERRADTTLVEVRIATGRPHQIRIHLAWTGHPLAGDPLYGAGGVPSDAPGLPGEGGYHLHAWRVGFTHPRTTRPCTVTAPLPDPLRSATER